MMSAQSLAGLRCAYLAPEAVERALHSHAGSLLGGVCFKQSGPGNALTRLNTEGASWFHDSTLHDSAIHRAALAQLSMPPLGSTCPDNCLYELWFAQGTIDRGRHGPVHYSHNGEWLYGVIEIDEQIALSHSGQEPKPATTPLQHASETAYTALFNAVDALGYPAILRVWNYIANINGESFGVERYRQFNTGRQDGFIAGGRIVTGSVPAASAVGMEDGPLTVCFLASRNSALTAIENPRQVSAYRYPKHYGVTSPTFARACLAPIAGAQGFFLSGTASIVGHETLHIDDVIAQAHETLANISAILDEAKRVQPGISLGLADLCCKVYVRNPDDVGALEGVLREILGLTVSIVYVQADICRANLAMEIEATAGLSMAFSV